MSENRLVQMLERYRLLESQEKEMKVREREVMCDWLDRTGQDVPDYHSSRPVELIALQELIRANRQEVIHLAKSYRVTKFVRALQG